MMQIETRVGKNRLSFRWEKELTASSCNELWIDYPINISRLPKHVANFMAGIILVEIFNFNQLGEIKFDELTEAEIECINDHLRLAAQYKIYNNKTGFTGNWVSAERIVLPDKIIRKKKSLRRALFCNGMGKDALLTVNLLMELGYCLIGFYVGNQFLDKRIRIKNGKSKSSKFLRGIIWQERVKHNSDFLARHGIDYYQIMTNFVSEFQYYAIPWWLFGLPLAYRLGIDTVAFGASFGENKLMSNGLPIWLQSSLFSAEYLKRVTGLRFSNSLMGLSDFGVQKLLIERYPESLIYQYSCMKSVLYCNECAKCWRTELWIKGCGYDPVADLKLPIQITQSTTKTDLATCDVVNEIEKKLRAEPYFHWVEQINTTAMQYCFEAKRLAPIFEQYFETYDYDPPVDQYGNQNRPSEWQELLTTGWDAFWKKTLDRD